MERITPKRFGHHANAFGFLRLLFASLVIVGHAPEIYDGNRSREILTRIFGTLSFGEMAVDGFFIISGYLISASYLKSLSPGSYLKKRIGRIYPGFLAAYFLCCTVVAALGGAALPSTLEQYIYIAYNAFLLQSPDVGAVFSGTPYPALNGALWTISYEFCCYIFLLLLGLLGLLDKRFVIISLTAVLLALSCAAPVAYHPFVGMMWEAIRLSAMFLSGACFYLYEDKINFSRQQILLAALGLTIALFFHHAAHAGMAVCGGFIILGVAKSARTGFISRINNENDISYGVYLYAWPVAKLLLWFWPSMPVPAFGTLTLMAAYILGWLSWLLVEKPVMTAIRRQGSEK